MNANATRLSGITQELRGHWQDTKAFWRDAKSQEFEDKYLAELISSVDKTLAVIEQLDRLTSKLRKDCE